MLLRHLRVHGGRFDSRLANSAHFLVARHSQRLLSIVAVHEAFEVVGVVGSASDLQVSSVFEDALGAGVLEGGACLVEVVDGFTPHLTHFQHFILFLN